MRGAFEVLRRAAVQPGESQFVVAYMVPGGGPRRLAQVWASGLEVARSRFLSEYIKELPVIISCTCVVLN